MKSEIAVFMAMKRVHGFFITFSWDFHEKEMRSKGGLYHVMFLVRFLLFFRACSCGGCMLTCGRVHFLLGLSGKG